MHQLPFICIGKTYMLVYDFKNKHGVNVCGDHSNIKMLNIETRSCLCGSNRQVIITMLKRKLKTFI